MPGIKLVWKKGLNNMTKSISKMMLKLMDKMMSTCDVITERVSESMDHKISFGANMQMRMHIMGCKFCREYEKQLLAIKNILAKCSEMNSTLDDQDIVLDDTVRERIKDNLKNKEK